MVTKLCLRVLLEATQVIYQSKCSYVVWRLQGWLCAVTKLESCNDHNQQINSRSFYCWNHSKQHMPQGLLMRSFSKHTSLICERHT